MWDSLLSRPSFQRWVRGQQVGFLTFTASRAVSPFHHNAEQLLWDALPVLLGRSAPPDWLENVARVDWEGHGNAPSLVDLPVQSLRLIRDALAGGYAGQDLTPFGAEAHRTLVWLGATSSAASGISKVTTVGTWGAHVLYGSASAERLLRLGNSLFGGSYRQPQSPVDSFRLNGILAKLRRPFKDTAYRCEQVANFIEAIDTAYPEGWPTRLLANYLYHHQFAWPVFVAGAGYGFSLPVAVDVKYHLDHQENEFPIEPGNGPISFVSGEGAAQEDWRDRLEKAAQAGKHLWRSKHGHTGTFRHLVMSSRVTAGFDFSIAQKVAGPVGDAYREAELTPPLSLADGSAEAYFAQVVLGRLLGRSPSLVSIASGGIGKRKKDTDGRLTLNYDLVEPKGIRSKLRYLFDAHHYERVVLPHGAEGEVALLLADIEAAHQGETEGDDSRQTAEVIFAPHLAGMADAVHAGGWRQFSYVRAPDAVWALYGKWSGGKAHIKALIPDEGEMDAEVRRALDALRDPDNTQTVRELDVSPAAVASALYYLNGSAVRTQNPDQALSPSLSWSFIRVHSDQDSLRFWQLVLRSCGAPPRDVEELLEVPLFERTVEVVADALSRFEPALDRPAHRSPDVLVLVGLEKLAERAQSDPLPKSDPYRILDVLNALEGRLGLAPDDKHVLIGTTRVLMIPDRTRDVTLWRETLDGQIENWRDRMAAEYGTPDVVSAEDALRMLGRLALFRDGFSQRLAAYSLRGFGFLKDSVRDVVLRTAEEGSDELGRKPGLLRRFGPTYYVPEHVRQPVLDAWHALDDDQDDRRLRLAETHRLISYGFAPALLPGVPPTISADVSLEPEVIAEVEHHADRARRLFSPGSPDRDAVHNVLNSVALYAGTPHWRTVARFLTGGNRGEAFELALDLIDRAESKGYPHAGNYVLAARAAARVSASNQSDPDMRDLATEKAEEWFGLALERAPRSEAPAYARALALSYSADHFLSREEDKAKQCLDDLIALADSGELNRYAPLVGLGARAFVWRGNLEPNHSDAFHYYRHGTELASGWFDLWPLAFGAARLSGHSVVPIKRDLVRMLDTRFEIEDEVLSDALPRASLLAHRCEAHELRHAKPDRRPHVSCRRERGVAVLHRYIRQGLD